MARTTRARPAPFERTLRQKLIRTQTCPLSTIDELTPSYLFLVTLFTDINFRRADTVFALPDVMLEVLAYCDWFTIMCFSRTSVQGRTIAQAAVRWHLRPLLEPFFPSETFFPFMAMLNELGGGIIGSIPRLLLAQNSVMHMCMQKSGDTSFRAFDLNIVVPRGKLESCRTWFKRRGYLYWADLDISLPYLSTVSAFSVSVRYSLTGETVCPIPSYFVNHV
jgi:hypothetical protein